MSLGNISSCNTSLYLITLVGQHFLKNNEVVDAIVSKAAIRSTDIVLEIGCGTGVMTKRLLEQGKKVNVVEIDPRMIAEVQKLVQGTTSEKKLNIIHGDALKVELPFFDVSNRGVFSRERVCYESNVRTPDSHTHSTPTCFCRYVVQTSRIKFHQL